VSCAARTASVGHGSWREYSPRPRRGSRSTPGGAAAILATRDIRVEEANMWRRLAAVSLLAVAPAAVAQTAIQPGTITGTFHGKALYFGENMVLYTVPAGRNARVTDIIVSNHGVAACTMSFYFGQQDFYVLVQPGAMAHLPLLTGIGLLSGQSVSLFPDQVPCEGAFVQIRGFTFTIP
jgi:hypothetical protein